MWFWKLMILKDSWLCSLVNFGVKFLLFFNWKRAKLLAESKKINKPLDDDIFIILNGPSLKNQDLSKIVGKTSLFVNRGFMHPLYRKIQPSYHMFIDPKMLTGEWALSWIDDIVDMVPNIKIILPVSWAFEDKLQPYIQKKTPIIWVDDSSPARLLGVGGYSILFGINCGYRSIYFTGFEATGLAHEMINSASHFYGVNEENLKKTTSDYISDLYMFSRHLNDLTWISTLGHKKGIKIINLTEGGILDMFERNTIHNLFSNNVAKVP